MQAYKNANIVLTLYILSLFPMLKLIFVSAMLIKGDVIKMQYLRPWAYLYLCRFADESFIDQVDWKIELRFQLQLSNAVAN